FSLPSALAPSSGDFGSSLLCAAAFSSSLSGASGEGRSLRRTIRYALRVTLRSALERSSQPVVGPTSVLAVKNRYWPFLSNDGKRASLRPSVSWKYLFWSSE